MNEKQSKTHTTLVSASLGLEVLLRERNIPDVEIVLSKSPGSPLPGQRIPSAFMNHIDVTTSPPKDGSTEAHSVQRAKSVLNRSDKRNPAEEVVRDHISITDRRWVGLCQGLESFSMSFSRNNDRISGSSVVYLAQSKVSAMVNNASGVKRRTFRDTISHKSGTTRRGVNDAAAFVPRLVLLPPETDFKDMIVQFPGAKLPLWHGWTMIPSTL
ncbi:hypothetical protein TruAng_006472 [Truncatella angustata]|nr:hypothetical protein TruAng_006472 [Truncatella angustata]